MPDRVTVRFRGGPLDGCLRDFEAGWPSGVMRFPTFSGDVFAHGSLEPIPLQVGEVQYRYRGKPVNGFVFAEYDGSHA